IAPEPAPAFGYSRARQAPKTPWAAARGLEWPEIQETTRRGGSFLQPRPPQQPFGTGARPAPPPRPRGAGPPHSGVARIALRHRVGDRVEHRRLLGARQRLERRDAETARFDDRDLAVIEIDRLLRVAHQRGSIRRDEHLFVADTEDHRTAIARDDDLLRMP